MIEVENLSKRYGDKLAVDGLSFVVQPGIVMPSSPLDEHCAALSAPASASRFVLVVAAWAGRAAATKTVANSKAIAVIVEISASLLPATARRRVIT